MRAEHKRFQAIYSELNVDYFDGNLPNVWIERGSPEDLLEDSDDLLAMTRTTFIIPRNNFVQGKDQSDEEWAVVMATFGGPSNYTASHHIYIHPDVFKLDRLREAILHEMCHIATIRRYGRKHGGHGKRFAAECNRIGVPLGWGWVFAADEDNDEDEDCRYWPGIHLVLTA